MADTAAGGVAAEPPGLETRKPVEMIKRLALNPIHCRYGRLCLGSQDLNCSDDIPSWLSIPIGIGAYAEGGGSPIRAVRISDRPAGEALRGSGQLPE